MTDNTTFVTTDASVPEVNPTVPEQAAAEQQSSSKHRAVRMILIVVAILLALLLCLSGFLAVKFLGANKTDGSTDTAGITWVRSIYAIGPKSEDKIAPASVSPIPDGSGWVITDANNGRYIKVRPNLSVSDVVVGDNDNQLLYQPGRIFVRRDGSTLVARPSSGDIWALAPNGNRLFTIAGPVAQSLAANDEMIVVGTRNGFVAYTNEGKGIGTVGTAGQGRAKDQFDGVSGIWVDNENNVYTSDVGNCRLSKWDEKGNLVWQKQVGPANNIGENLEMDKKPKTDAKKYPAAMQYPMGITMDGAGRLIVADMLDFTLNAFDPETGKFLAKYGTYGELDGQLTYPVDIKYNRNDDTFMVAENGIDRAQIIKLPDSGGNAFAGLRGLLNGPLGACLIPLLIIILLIVVYLVSRTLFRRHQKDSEDAIEATDEMVSEDIAALDAK